MTRGRVAPWISSSRASRVRLSAELKSQEFAVVDCNPFSGEGRSDPALAIAGVPSRGRTQTRVESSTNDPKRMSPCDYRVPSQYRRYLLF